MNCWKRFNVDTMKLYEAHARKFKSSSYVLSDSVQCRMGLLFQARVLNLSLENVMLIFRNYLHLALKPKFINIVTLK